MARIISWLLGGCDYVIAHDQGTIEIIVLGKRKAAAELQIVREQHAKDQRVDQAKRAAAIQAQMQQRRVDQ